MIALATPDNQIDALPLGVVVHGDALEVLKTMETSSVDAIVTDPPAGISFMGKEWDNFSGKAKLYNSQAEKDASYNKYGKGALPYGFSSSSGQPTKQERDAFIAFLSSVMAEALRVLKPGGHALVWALPRTSHWTALALEDAGFEIRDCVYHVFGSGFPKSTAIDKQIDKRLGAEREVVGARMLSDITGGNYNKPGDMPNSKLVEYTAPATPEAAQWDGWGTALKPAVECWWLCRKPLAKPSIAANVLTYGTGGLNIDKTRVGLNGEKPPSGSGSRESWRVLEGRDDRQDWHPHTTPAQGRWPANLLLSHSLWCTPNGTKRVRSHGHIPLSVQQDGSWFGLRTGITAEQSNNGYADPDGTEEVEDWQCAEDCPIRILELQSKGTRAERSSGGHTRHNRKAVNPSSWSLPAIETSGYDDSKGGASRYFTNLPPDVPFLYTAKASRSERNAGCEGLPERSNQEHEGRKGQLNSQFRPDGSEKYPVVHQNSHPTVKPLALCRWLVRLITPPDGIVLDPFCGSGTTLVACVQEGYHFIGIEESSEYVAIAEARIAHARREV